MNLNSWLLLAITMPFVVIGQNNHTPILDMIPVLSVLKGGVQLIAGDGDGSNQTIQNFHKDGILSSQLQSIDSLLKGNSTKALEIQKRFLYNLEPLVDGTPIVGHVKGLIHLILGDSKHGWEAIKSATSTTGTLVGGAFGNVPGAVAGHVATDVIISAVESLIRNEWKLFGIVDYLKNIGSKSVGEHIDNALGMVMDFFGAKAVNRKGPKTVPFKHLKEEAIEMQNIPVKEGSPSLVSPHKEDGLETSVPYERLKEDVDGKTVNVAIIPIKEEPPKPVSFQSRLETRTNNRNMINQRVQEEFCKHDKFFNPLYERKNIELFQKSGEVLLYQKSDNLKNLDLNSLTARLRYLSVGLRTVIEKNDFRTVNTMNSDHVSCSIAGVLNLEINTLHTHLVEPHKLPNHAPTSSTLFDSLVEMKNSNFIEFSSSVAYTNLHRLKSYFLTEGKKYDNNGIILEMKTNDGLESHSVGIKCKMIDFEPELLLLDYQKHGLKLPNLPNPDRFISFVDTTKYSKFTIYRINPLKPLMILNKQKIYRNRIVVSS